MEITVEKLSGLLIVLSILTHTGTVAAVSKDQKQHESELQSIAERSCDTEIIEGEDYNIKAIGDGNIEVSFLGKKGGELGAKFVYTKETWEGRQRVRQEEQHDENFNRRKCIKEELNYLRKTYSPPQKKVIYYGAYSLSSSLDTGWSSRQESLRAAEDLALDRCDDIHCDIFFTVQGDECGTVVGGYGRWHYGIATTRANSRQNAISICSDYGSASGCNFVKTICASNKDRY